MTGVTVESNQRQETAQEFRQPILVIIASKDSTKVPVLQDRPCTVSVKTGALRPMYF